jgi:O-antigen/teichoic acid export membrane protein
VLGQCLRRWNRLLAWISLPGALLLAWLMPKLLIVFYGERYVDAGLPGAVMLLAVPFIVANALYFNAAVAVRDTATHLTTYLLTAGVALFLNFVLGWGLGAIGIAVAVVIREAFMFFMFRVRLRLAPLPLRARQANL